MANIEAGPSIGRFERIVDSLQSGGAEILEAKSAKVVDGQTGIGYIHTTIGIAPDQDPSLGGISRYGSELLAVAGNVFRQKSMGGGIELRTFEQVQTGLYETITIKAQPNLDGAKIVKK